MQFRGRASDENSIWSTTLDRRPPTRTGRYTRLVNVDKLMRRLDRLDHHERLLDLTQHVRKLSDADAQALGHALAQGDVHQRGLALHVAAVRRDADAAMAALEDPSMLVRRCAAQLAGRLASSWPADLLDRVDAESLGRLAGEVVRRRIPELAQALCEGLCARERLAEAARLLSACPPEWIAAQLDVVAWPDAAWLRLAKHQPDLLCARIDRQFAEAERGEQVLARYGSEVWARLCEQRPQRVADWIDRHVSQDEFPFALASGLVRLCKVLPGRVVGYLAARPRWLAAIGVPRALVTRARSLDDDRLAPLCRVLAQTQPAMLASLLSELSFPRRAELFTRATAELETARIEWPLSLLAVLPRALADREATRMLGLRRAATDGSWRRQLLGHRAIADARALLERECQSAQAEERAEALAALVAASARAAGSTIAASTRGSTIAASTRGSTELGQTLAYLRRIKNEQDPVRLAAITALAAVPGDRFEDPAALDVVLSPIFDARDTSWATRQQTAKVAHKLLIAHARTPKSAAFALGLSLLERLAGQQGTPDLPRLDRNLPRGAEQAIVAALLPWVRAAQKRQQDYHAFQLWTALGKRAWRVPELGTLIGDVIWHGHKASAGTAVAYWLADPATRDARACELVRKDRSALYLHPVFTHCLRRRQTLLFDRLAPKAPRGRFHDGKVVMVPLVERGFHRWPIALQQAYIDLIQAAEAEPQQFMTTRARLVMMRARVPITGIDDLAGALASKDIAVQEAALGALVWLDSPAPGLPILLEHLDGDRARVAMYAMPRLARLLARTRMVDALAQLLERPQIKVTVHKEALRLLGMLATPRAIELLRATWTRALHRDVRIGALHAARSVLWASEAWVILASAATDDEPDVARALVEVPIVTVAGRHRGAYLQLMLAAAEHPSPIVRASLFTALAQRWSWVDPLASVDRAARVVERLDPLDPWAAAARIVAGGAASEPTHPIIERLLETLTAAAELELAPTGENDRLSHRRVAALIDALEHERHPISLRLLEALAAKLLARPEWWSVAVRLDLAATPSERLGARILELIAVCPTARSLTAIELAARNLASLALRDWSREQAQRIVAELAEGPAHARIVALAMLEPFGRRWGWGEPWESTLGRLRSDADLDVRTAARALWLGP